MQNYLNQFPSFDDTLPTLEGFEDSSWHNDACPSLTKEMPNGFYWQIFVDYKNQNLSDWADIDPEDYHRFNISLMDADGYCHQSEGFDSWEDLLVWFNLFNK